MDMKGHRVRAFSLRCTLCASFLSDSRQLTCPPLIFALAATSQYTLAL